MGRTESPSRPLFRKVMLVVLAVMHPITLDLMSPRINLLVRHEAPVPYMCAYLVVCAAFTFRRWDGSGPRATTVSRPCAVLLLLAALALANYELGVVWLIR